MNARWRELFLAACLTISSLATARLAADASLPEPSPHVSAERTGVLPTRDGLELTVTADCGDVRVFDDAVGEVRYRVVLEGETDDPAALEGFSLTARQTRRGIELAGQMPWCGGLQGAWAIYEIHVPRRYSLRVSTQAGNVLAPPMDGQVILSTGGGHITAGDVAGTLRAVTGGGHISAGNVAGNTFLQTAGGHIHVGRVGGTARLATGGGNVVAERAAEGLIAETAGGRMELAEAIGSIRARTAGGGMRIARVAGPTQLDSGSGGIFLGGIQAPVRVSTRKGNITAWFSPQSGEWRAVREGGLRADFFELLSGQGDIIVYLPREMPLTIDALVQEDSAHHVFGQPSLPLVPGPRAVNQPGIAQRMWTLNGGGRALRLRAGAGDIRLRSFESRGAQRRMASALGHDEVMPEIESSVAPPQASAPGRLSEASDAPSTGRLGAWTRRMESLWRGGVRVDPAEQQTRLVHSAPPVYPEAARQAGIEGQVTLGLRIGRNGLVEDVRLLSGEPVLGRAAMEAVEQWRYAPLWISGQAVRTLTTVTLAFELR
jgi:TonB family protein